MTLAQSPQDPGTLGTRLIHQSRQRSIPASRPVSPTLWWLILVIVIIHWTSSPASPTPHAANPRTYRLAFPIEGEVDTIPAERNVRYGPVGRSARSQQPHVAIFGELKLRHPTVHLVGLAEDEMARICAACRQAQRQRREDQDAPRAHRGRKHTPELGESVRT